MGQKRLTRVNELLKREVADALYRTMGAEGVDLAAVTVTHVVTSSDLRHARVLVSVRADEDTQRQMISSLYRHRKDIQDLVGKDMTLKYTPRLSFHLDDSLAAGDNVLQILNGIEAEHPEWQEEDGPEEEPTPDPS